MPIPQYSYVYFDIYLMDKTEHVVAGRRTRPISTATRRTRKSNVQKCDSK